MKLIVVYMDKKFVVVLDIYLISGTFTAESVQNSS